MRVARHTGLSTVAGSAGTGAVVIAPSAAGLTSSERPRLSTLALTRQARVLSAAFADPPLNFATTAFIRDLDTLDFGHDWLSRRSVSRSRYRPP